MKTALLALILAAVAVAVGIWIWRVRRKGTPRWAAEDDVRQLARDREWTCDIRPSPKIQFRLSGRSPDGIRWMIVQGMDAGAGPRWSTDDIQFPQLLLEVVPAAEAEEKSGAASMASQKLASRGYRYDLSHPSLSGRYVLLAHAPNVAANLFTQDVQGALAAVPSDSVRIALGFPNLRVGLQRPPESAHVVGPLADLGIVIARRLREIGMQSTDM